MPTIDPPDTRECERCGRREVWKNGAWRVADDQVGNLYCIHEWDVTGDYSPIRINTNRRQPPSSKS